MADLTPEQLDKLEAIALHLEEDDGTEDGDHVGVVLDALPTLVADARKLASIRALAAEGGLTSRFTLAKIKEVLNG